MEQDKDKTVVIFRKWMGDIIALFPMELDSVKMNRTFVSSYQHVGQHSGADLQFIIQKSKPANPEEYGDLKEELESIGYNLTVVKRTPSNSNAALYDQYKEMYK